MMVQWHLHSKKISAVVNKTGAMLGQVVVDMGNGFYTPLATAPWAEDPRKDSLVPILRDMQGEWLCVPFGVNRPLDKFYTTCLPTNHEYLDSLVSNEFLHGITSNQDWHLLEHNDDYISLEIDFPKDYPIEKAIRTIKLNDDINGVEFTFTVIAREDVIMPIGIHPVFAVSSEPYKTRIVCGGYSIGKTYPIRLESTSEFKIGESFESLSAVPRIDNGTEDATYYPFENNREELVQLLNIDSSVSIERHDLGYKSILKWESDKLPHCCLWMSCKGRSEYPWLDRYLALGVEPTHSYFDLNPSLAMADNTAHPHGLVKIFHKKPFAMNYSITFEKIEESQDGCSLEK